MDKEYWEIRLQAYVDNELEPADRQAVEAYMEEHPEFKKRAEALSALKARLKLHAEDIQMPEAVGQRLNALFDSQGPVVQKKSRKHGLFYTIAAIAAVILLAILAPNTVNEPYNFEETVLVGEVVCPGCVISERVGLEKNDLCESGHVLGIQTDAGELYRIADDSDGQAIRSNWSLYKKRVKVKGSLLKPERLLRVQHVESVPVQSAHLHHTGHVHPSHSVALAP